MILFQLFFVTNIYGNVHIKYTKYTSHTDEEYIS